MDLIARRTSNEFTQFEIAEKRLTPDVAKALNELQAGRLLEIDLEVHPKSLSSKSNFSASLQKKEEQSSFFTFSTRKRGSEKIVSIKGTRRELLELISHQAVKKASLKKD